jgi:hypothetical protein
MSHPFGTELVTCPMCGEEVQADLIMDATGLCCDCDPENQENCKADEMMDAEIDA